MAEQGKEVEVKKEAGQTAQTRVDPFDSLRQEMNRLFDSFSSGFPMGRRLFDLSALGGVGSDFAKVPAVDVSETDTEFKISAELPGMSEKDVNVSLSGNMLTIKGEKKEEREEKGENRYLSERRYGSYQRSFRLPDGVDADKVGGAFRDGVLTVTLPKTKETQAKSRKIEIKSS